MKTSKRIWWIGLGTLGLLAIIAAILSPCARIATVQFYKREVGTVFEGVPQPNVTISELLRRQAVFQLSSK